jgi:hypothetical protein
MLTDEQQADLLQFETYSAHDKHAINRALNGVRAGFRDSGVEPVADEHESARALRAAVIAYFNASAGNLSQGTTHAERV